MSDTVPDDDDGAPSADDGLAWRDLPFLRGAAAGLVAFLVGYGVTYLLRGSAIERRLNRPAEQGGFFHASPTNGTGYPQPLRDGYNISASGPRELVGGNLTEVGASPPDTGRVVGWLYTDLHNVPSGGTHTVATPSAVYEFDLALTMDAGGVLLAFPPLLLLAAGYLVAERSVAADLDPRESAAAGATVAVGYVLAAFAVAQLSYWNAEGRPEDFGGDIVFEYAFGPDVLFAVAVAGVAYPVVFGGAGGYLAALFGPTRVGGRAEHGDSPETPGAFTPEGDDPAEWGDDVYSPRDFDGEDDEEETPVHQPGGGPAVQQARDGPGDAPTGEQGTGSAATGTPGTSAPDTSTAGASADADATTGDDGVDYRDVDYDESRYMPDEEDETA